MMHNNLTDEDSLSFTDYEMKNVPSGEAQVTMVKYPWAPTIQETKQLYFILACMRVALTLFVTLG